MKPQTLSPVTVTNLEDIDPCIVRAVARVPNGSGMRNPAELNRPQPRPSPAVGTGVPNNLTAMFAAAKTAAAATPQRKSQESQDLARLLFSGLENGKR